MKKIIKIITGESGEGIEFLSSNIFDRCIVCNNLTPYKKDFHIDMRRFYVEGAGQLCETCYNKCYEP